MGFCLLISSISSSSTIWLYFSCVLNVGDLHLCAVFVSLSDVPLFILGVYSDDLDKLKIMSITPQRLQRR